MKYRLTATDIVKCFIDSQKIKLPKPGKDGQIHIDLLWEIDPMNKEASTVLITIGEDDAESKRLH